MLHSIVANRPSVTVTVRYQLPYSSVCYHTRYMYVTRSVTRNLPVYWPNYDNPDSFTPVTTTSNLSLSYINCILAGLHDCQGEEAKGYIDNRSHPSNNMVGNTTAQPHSSSWFTISAWVHLIGIDLWTAITYVDICEPHALSGRRDGTTLSTRKRSNKQTLHYLIPELQHFRMWGIGNGK